MANIRDFLKIKLLDISLCILIKPLFLHLDYICHYLMLTESS